MKCVMTFYNPDGVENNCGYKSFRDMLFSTALSSVVAKRHFDKVVMYTTSEWKQLYQDLDFKFDGYDTKLDELNIDKWFWAYTKLRTYCDQKEPFVHIDNDVFLWDGLPKKFEDARYFFQSQEPFRLPGYGYYTPLRTIAMKAPVHPDEIKEINDFAYNCGICGGHDSEIFKKHIKFSEAYIFAIENYKHFYHDYKHMIMHQNLYHEQYMLASLIKHDGLRSICKVLAEDIHDINKDGYRYTHLWGASKKDPGIPEKVRARLKKEDPDMWTRLLNVDLKQYGKQ